MNTPTIKVCKIVDEDGAFIIASFGSVYKVFYMDDAQKAPKLKNFIDGIFDFDDEDDALNALFHYDVDIVTCGEDNKFGVAVDDENGNAYVFETTDNRKDAEDAAKFILKVIDMTREQNSGDDEDEDTDAHHTHVENCSADDEDEEDDEDAAKYKAHCDKVTKTASKLVQLQGAIKELTDAKTACDFLLVELHATYTKFFKLLEKS